MPPKQFPTVDLQGRSVETCDAFVKYMGDDDLKAECVREWGEGSRGLAVHQYVYHMQKATISALYIRKGMKGDEDHEVDFSIRICTDDKPTLEIITAFILDNVPELELKRPK